MRQSNPFQPLLNRKFEEFTIMPGAEIESFDVGQIITLLVIAIFVGWLAGVITRGGGFGLLGDIVVAVAGAFAGYYLFDFLGISLGGGYLDLIVTATVGAVIVVMLIRLVKRI